jgi:hypothetical protein
VDLDTTSYTVSGLRAPVEILIDRWGVPHVYASSRYDAFSPRVRATADERSRPLRKDGQCSSQQDSKRAPRSMLKQETIERC